jgi:serine protease inhibitor
MIGADDRWRNPPRSTAPAARGPRRRSMRASVQVMLLAVLAWSIADSRGAPRVAGAAGESPAATVADAGNDFGFRLLRTLAAEPGAGNVIISPLSVSQALAMTYNGARGKTKTAMARALGFGSIDDQRLNDSNRRLLEALRKADPDTRLEIADALWLRKGMAINPQFVALGKDFYRAEVERLDFAGNPGGATATINGWVDRVTQGKIPSIVSDLKRDTVLVLTDAVYFKGAWVNPFEPSNTKPRAFFLPGGKSLTTPMMERRGFYPYLETGDFQAIRLPYGNEQFAMYVFLPRRKDGLSTFLESLNRQDWAEWIGKLANANGTIVLPKFQLRYGRNLNGALTAMGMGVAFDKMAADFSGIESSQPIHISDVEHKTYVKVDERGTEAAAATAVTMRPLAVFAGPGEPFNMIVDHPFAFAIAERETGALLFVGAVVDPERS